MQMLLLFIFKLLRLTKNTAVILADFLAVHSAYQKNVQLCRDKKDFYKVGVLLLVVFTKELLNEVLASLSKRTL